MSSANSLSAESTSKHKKMMKCGRGVRVYVKGDSEEATTQGQIRIQDWNQRERTLRALKFGGACWGAALVSIIIPLLHFLLVPVFLLAGPIVAFIVMGQKSVVLGGEGICPKCQAFLPIARAALRFPISDLCTCCQSSVKIESQEEA